MRHGRLRWMLTGLAALTGLVPAVSADELELRGGGRLRGIIVERSATSITIETGPGLVTLPLARVLRIRDGRAALEVWRERSARLSPADLAGWVALARWAAEQDLLTQARIAWERVLTLDPGHPEAHGALGQVLQDGRWTVREEPRPVPEAADDGRSAAESAARVREAEARAREAEARARSAEAAATASARTDEGDGGIPVWWAYGSPSFGGPPRDRDLDPASDCCAPPPQAEPDRPTHVTPASSVAPTRAPRLTPPGAVHDRSDRSGRSGRSSLR